MRQVALGLIGAGAWGLNHLRVATSEQACLLLAVADPDEQSRARARAHAPSAQIFADHRDVLADSRVEAVIIASPSPTHARIAIDALAAGKHVLVEKPLAMSIADALAVQRSAREHRRIVMVGHLMLFHPAFLRLAELLRSGELGELRYSHTTRVNLGRIRRDENALWSLGPHDLSMLDYLHEELPTTVTARGQCVVQSNVEDVVFMTLRYASGELAHVHLSWLSPRKERRVTLVCSHKMVEFDDVAVEKLRIFDKGYDQPPHFTEYSQYLTLRDGEVRIPTIEMQEPLRLQLRHLLTCILSGQAPRSDAECGVRVVRILEAAAQSLALDGAPVTLSPQFR